MIRFLLSTLMVLGFTAPAMAEYVQCELVYDTLEDKTDAIFYYQLHKKNEQAKAGEILTQMTCEDGEAAKAKLLQIMKDKCSGLMIGNISVPVATFDFQSACG